MRPVGVGQRHGDLVVIASGLKAGERVIVERQMFVFPGMPVRDLSTAAAAGGAPPGGEPATGMEPAR
jgi:multidrug efflux system membrane fusion protein